mmetsp:Transcript_21210/g.71839  ORF Transcript_21210/g.71839 Transcript_21210/m.71839 type:complete len:209 (-) Transcript_21210:702-1328(-)
MLGASTSIVLRAKMDSRCATQCKSRFKVAASNRSKRLEVRSGASRVSRGVESPRACDVCASSWRSAFSRVLARAEAIGCASSVGFNPEFFFDKPEFFFKIWRRPLKARRRGGAVGDSLAQILATASKAWARMRGSRSTTSRRTSKAAFCKVSSKRIISPPLAAAPSPRATRPFEAPRGPKLPETTADEDSIPPLRSSASLNNVASRRA